MEPSYRGPPGVCEAAGQTAEESISNCRTCSRCSNEEAPTPECGSAEGASGAHESLLGGEAKEASERVVRSRKAWRAERRPVLRHGRATWRSGERFAEEW